MAASLKLKAIFFDIDDTLFSTTAFAEKARRNAIEAMIRAGLRVDPDDAMQELKEIIGEFSSNHNQHFDKLLQRLPARMSAGINPVILVASAVMGYHRTKYTDLKPFPEIEKLLVALNAQPLILGVITDGLAIKQAGKLLWLDLYQYFHPQAIFISDQIGISKPNKKLFAKACAKTGIKPAKTMYLGNDPIQDVDAANAAGMTSVLVRRKGIQVRPKGATQPDYEIKDLTELAAILKDDFAINVVL